MVRSRIDMDLEMKLDGLKKHTGGKDKRKDILDTILDRMTKEAYRVRKRYERDVESALLVGLPHKDDP